MPRRVFTRLGRRVRRGTDEWDKPLIDCPRCGAMAVVEATRDVWCVRCGYSSAGLSGCT